MRRRDVQNSTIEKRTPAGFLVGMRMSEKKTGCRWTNNWHLSGICCTFHRIFFVLLVPLKEAGYQAVCSLPEVVDRGLGLNWRSTEKGNFLASVMEWPKVCILWGKDGLNWTGSQALLRLPGSRTEAFRLHRIHFCLPEVPYLPSEKLDQVPIRLCFWLGWLFQAAGNENCSCIMFLLQW